MRAIRTAVLAVLFLPATVAAQSVTDGVLAIVRSDYETAVRVLTPYADNASDPDPLAAFFLATLYHSGRGVKVDDVRACSLYQTAGRTDGSPVASQAEALLLDLTRSGASALFWELCEQSRREHRSTAAARTGTGAPPQDTRTTTEAGIAAFVRKDYGVAAQTLAPAAEDWPLDDGAASFFMGLMYENGLGVAQDDFRACAMYTRGLRGSPVGDWQAGVLHASYMTRMSQPQFEECMLVGGTLGLHHGFEKATITLEPGYWVSIDLLGATVSNHGNEKRIDSVMGRPRCGVPSRAVHAVVERPAQEPASQLHRNRGVASGVRAREVDASVAALRSAWTGPGGGRHRGTGLSTIAP